MRRRHIVRQGECLLSISQRYGIRPDEIWNLGANDHLREQRGDGSALLPGDLLEIPPAPQTTLRVAARTTNRYRGEIAKGELRLTVVGRDGPRRGERFVLTIDGVRSEGFTDDDGVAVLRVPATAVVGVLTVGTGANVVEYHLDFGHMNPTEDLAGVQQRLNNLGYFCGTADGRLGPRTARALRAFQKARGLTESGEADDATRRSLQEQHGS